MRTISPWMGRLLQGLSWKKLFWILLGAAIATFGIHNIHQQAGITEGGVIGALLLAGHWLGFSPSVITVSYTHLDVYKRQGEQRWRDIVEAYWKLAVDQRGQYATGGQTSGEIWSAPQALGARLGDKNQEYCTVYNMLRLADYLLRWTGDARYADYIEMGIYNGLMAQAYCCLLYTSRCV